MYAWKIRLGIKINSELRRLKMLEFYEILSYVSYILSHFIHYFNFTALHSQQLLQARASLLDSNHFKLSYFARSMLYTSRFCLCLNNAVLN